MRARRSWTTLVGGVAVAGAAGLAGFGLSGAAPEPSELSGEEGVVIRVVREVSPSVVGIRTAAGAGSGLIIRADGVVLTNAHVVGPSPTVRVALATGQEVEGRVLGAARTVDIAVVQIPAAGLPTAPLGDSDEVEVGQSAIAIGNPVGFERTVTTGVLSAVNRSLGFGYEELLQTDAAINPGNSGGPLLDSRGRVIGINTAAVRELPGAGPLVGLGFAIPINLARQIADQLVAFGEVRRALLGIRHREIDASLASRFDLPVDRGVIVLAVGQGTPAAEAGLRPGDIIHRIDDVPIRSGGDLSRVLRAHQPGDDVTVHVIRPEGSVSLRVRLAEGVG